MFDCYHSEVEVKFKSPSGQYIVIVDFHNHLTCGHLLTKTYLVMLTITEVYRTCVKRIQHNDNYNYICPSY